MAFSRTPAALMLALSLAMAGGAAVTAWSHGRWLALTGALLTVGWLAALTLIAVRRPSTVIQYTAGVAEREATVHRLLLDASPTPLLLVDGAVVRTLNRAARRLFDTDDRVLPPPSPLLDRDASHLRHAGHSWRADRVDVGAQVVIALVDVESEERTAEARASAEMIQVLGHELLNGLVPIVALAESGVTAVAAEARDPALLAEILTTLARRAEGLQRFTEAYRSLARLPAPMKQVTSVTELIEDLARLFASRWPDAMLDVKVAGALSGRFDRDQLNQAIWALLQNAVEAARANAARPSVYLSATANEAVLTIEVADDGPGVAIEQASTIFRPFMTTKPAGTGIGLSLARQIALAHGGALTLEAGAATLFRLVLPSQPVMPPL